MSSTRFSKLATIAALAAGCLAAQNVVVTVQASSSNVLVNGNAQVDAIHHRHRRHAAGPPQPHLGLFGFQHRYRLRRRPGDRPRSWRRADRRNRFQHRHGSLDHAACRARIHVAPGQCPNPGGWRCGSTLRVRPGRRRQGHPRPALPVPFRRTVRCFSLLRRYDHRRLRRLRHRCGVYRGRRRQPRSGGHHTTSRASQTALQDPLDPLHRHRLAHHRRRRDHGERGQPNRHRSNRHARQRRAGSGPPGGFENQGPRRRRPDAPLHRTPRPPHRRHLYQFARRRRHRGGVPVSMVQRQRLPFPPRPAGNRDGRSRLLQRACPAQPLRRWPRPLPHERSGLVRLRAPPSPASSFRSPPSLLSRTRCAASTASQRAAARSSSAAP